METNDIVTKNFESYADVAADIINVLLHEGRRRVKDYEMLSAATESLYLDKENGLRNQLEDVAKYHVVNGVPKVLYLLPIRQRWIRAWYCARPGMQVENTADNMKNKIRAYIL